MISCSCASTTPTMPTERGEHLPGCPAYAYQLGVRDGRRINTAELAQRALDLRDRLPKGER